MNMEINNQDLSEYLWDACRTVSKPRLDDLAQRIIGSKAKIDDLVLPEQEKRLLHSIILHVGQRHRIYDEWGFQEKSNRRGIGITALFAGASGTWKNNGRRDISE